MNVFSNLKIILLSAFICCTISNIYAQTVVDICNENSITICRGESIELTCTEPINGEPCVNGAYEWEWHVNSAVDIIPDHESNGPWTVTPTGSTTYDLEIVTPGFFDDDEHIIASVTVTVVDGTSAEIVAKDNFAGRSKTDFGIGERINLTKPTTGTWKWEIDPPASGTCTNCDPATSTSTFDCPRTAENLTIKLVDSSSGMSCKEFDIEVVEPNGANIVATGGEFHTTGVPSVGMQTIFHLLPNTVSFKTTMDNPLYIAEGQCPAIVTGSFSSAANFSHCFSDGTFTPCPGATAGPGTPLSIGGGNATTGCRWLGVDNASWSLPVQTTYAVGTFTWNIDWEYGYIDPPATPIAANRDANLIHTATTVAQVFTIDAAGRMCVIKGPSVCKNLADPTSSY